MGSPKLHYANRHSVGAGKVKPRYVPRLRNTPAYAKMCVLSKTYTYRVGLRARLGAEPLRDSSLVPGSDGSMQRIVLRDSRIIHDKRIMNTANALRTMEGRPQLHHKCCTKMLASFPLPTRFPGAFSQFSSNGGSDRPIVSKPTPYRIALTSSHCRRC